MSSNSNCCCGGAGTTTTCESTIAELPRYYPRQLITPDDLTLEQNYFRDRMRRHNRLLHGWGVVCGALVCPATTTNSDGTISNVPYNVIVQTGYVLGPYGDEIILDCQRTLDVRTSGVSGVTGEPCLDAPDPWCTQVYNPPSSSGPTTVYIAVKYKQTMMRPVRVQPVGCGCADTTCEFSRWHDGYEIGVLQSCPCGCQPAAISQKPVNTNVPPTSTLNPVQLATTANPTCPDCTCGPWVGLAKVTFDQSGNIQTIDNCVCRRIVVSLSQATRSCTGVPPTVTSLNPTAIQSPATNLSMTVVGTGFYCGTSAQFATTDPLSVSQTQVQNAETLILTVNVSATAAATAAAAGGSLTATLTVTNADGSNMAYSATFTVSASTASGSAPSSPTGVSAQAHVTTRPAKLSQKPQKS
jgi:hypothetical protein